MEDWRSSRSTRRFTGQLGAPSPTLNLAHVAESSVVPSSPPFPPVGWGKEVSPKGCDIARSTFFFSFLPRNPTPLCPPCVCAPVKNARDARLVSILPYSLLLLGRSRSRSRSQSVFFVFSVGRHRGGSLVRPLCLMFALLSLLRLLGVACV